MFSLHQDKQQTVFYWQDSGFISFSLLYECLGFETHINVKTFLLMHVARPVFTHGARAQGGILKKSRLKYGMRKKKAVHEREI